MASLPDEILERSGSNVEGKSQSFILKAYVQTQAG